MVVIVFGRNSTNTCSLRRLFTQSRVALHQKGTMSWKQIITKTLYRFMVFGIVHTTLKIPVILTHSVWNTDNILINQYKNSVPFKICVPQDFTPWLETFTFWQPLNQAHVINVMSFMYLDQKWDFARTSIYNSFENTGLGDAQGENYKRYQELGHFVLISGFYGSKMTFPLITTGID